MNTQTVIQTPQALPPLMIVLNPLLLTETSSVTRPVDSGDLAPEELNVRATQITGVLKEILEQRGYPHGGLNE
jgi:hypothetical protein